MDSQSPMRDCKTKKCGPKPCIEFEQKRSGDYLLCCKECNEKKRARKRKRSIEENQDNIVDNNIVDTNIKETTNKSTRDKQARKERSRKEAEVNYKVMGQTTCIVTNNTPIQLAHIIPYIQNDSPSNIFPLRPDLHTSFDVWLWGLHPDGVDCSEEEYKRNGYSSNKYKNYKIVISPKCPDTESIREYEGQMVPIFDISEEFIKRAWEIYEEKNSPTP